MKRIGLLLVSLLLVLFPVIACLAEPLQLREDLTGSFVIPYDESRPEAGAFSYAYAYPQAADEDPRADKINVFYRYLASDTDHFTVPILADSRRETGISETFTVSYTITCSTDRFFSVLVCSSSEMEGEVPVLSYEGHVFSLEKGIPGSAYTLPEMLGILSAVETDDWLQSRQARRVNELVRSLVWDRIQENEEGLYDPSLLTEEDFASCFFPEEDFYLDENENPVFFLQPGTAAAPEAGLLTFPISMEELRDEM